MNRSTDRLDNLLSDLNNYRHDLDVLTERDERVSVGIENFNTYSEQCNSELITTTIPNYETLEAGREGLGNILKAVKNKILELINTIMNSMSIMFAKATSLTGMMKRGLLELEDQINGDVVFNKDNRVEYNKLNEMNYLDGISIESSMLENISNIQHSYNESVGKFIKVIDQMVEHQVSWMQVTSNLTLGRLDLLNYQVIIKQLKDITSDRAGTDLKKLLDKKFSGGKASKFVHYALFKTSKEVRLVLLDFKKCKKDEFKIKGREDVCSKLKVVSADAKVIINRDNPMDTLKEKYLEDLITRAVKSMDDYDPVDIEKAIGDRILDLKKQISESKGTNKRAVSNLTVIVNYYASLMKYSTTFIFNQHKMNYKSLKYLVQMSGE